MGGKAQEISPEQAKQQVQQSSEAAAQQQTDESKASIKSPTLAGALALAQGMFKPIVKDKTAKVRMKSGGEYSYDYADLATVIEATREGRAANGLAVTQLPVFISGAFTLHTKLIHESGESESCYWPLPAPNTPPQEMGSALTYARRYSYCAILGIATEDDDDGAAGNNTKHQQGNQQRQQAAQGKPAQQGGQNKQQDQQGQQQKAADKPKEQAWALVNPATGEFETFPRKSSWLTKLEERLNNSDQPLDWFDANKRTFENVRKALAEFPAGIEHCDKITALVSDIQKAALDPVNDGQDRDYGDVP